MEIVRNFCSPNFDSAEIKVEFIVLHYTATSIERTLEIFMDPERKASSHLVIDREGQVFETVQCLSGPALRSWHAGKSHLERRGLIGKQMIEGFNDRAIGIELVNPNGNVFNYTDAQYQALRDCVMELRSRYPELQGPESVVGHEHVAGFRGKCDPGRCFDWMRFFDAVYPGQPHPIRHSLCTEVVARCLADHIASAGSLAGTDDSGKNAGHPASTRFFETLSSLLEQALAMQPNTYTDPLT